MNVRELKDALATLGDHLDFVEVLIVDEADRSFGTPLEVLTHVPTDVALVMRTPAARI